MLAMRLMPVTPPAFCRGLALLLAVCCLAGCGKKAPPFLPESRQPKIFSRSGAAPFRSGILVWWEEEARLPAAPSGGWESYHVLRTGKGGEAVEVRSVPQRGRGGSRYEYLDLDIGRGERYSYLVRLADVSGGRFHDSGESVAVAGGGPAPPFGLTARADDGLVELTWEAPALEGESGSPVGFNVFRRSRDGEYTLGTPLNPGMLAAPRFLDAGGGGAGYCYSVTSVAEGSESLEESIPSSEVCVPEQGPLP